MSLSAAVSVYIKFFFLLTPFFILAVFLALTEKVETRMQRALAGRVTVGIVLTSILLFSLRETILISSESRWTLSESARVPFSSFPRCRSPRESFLFRRLTAHS